jgi:uncharacterized membrane protein YeiH
MNNILDEKIDLEKEAWSFKKRPAIIWFSLFLIGILFKIQHWPWASLLILIDSAGLTAYSISGMITLKGRHSLNNILCIATIFWMIYLVRGLFYNQAIQFNALGLAVYAAVFVICLVVYELLKRRKNRADK